MKHIVLVIWILLGLQVGSMLFYGVGDSFFGAVTVSEGDFLQTGQRNIGEIRGFISNKEIVYKVSDSDFFLVDQRNIGASFGVETTDIAPQAAIFEDRLASVELSENGNFDRISDLRKSDKAGLLEQSISEIFGLEYKTWLRYPEHLAGPLTGGFGEQSCHSCHFDYDVNMSDGILELTGMPEKVTSGNTYELEVLIGRPDLGAAGFQLTARFEDGSQAGSFTLNDAVILTPNTPGTAQYVQHAVKNISPEDDQKVWKFAWTAPERIHKKKEKSESDGTVSKPSTDRIIFNIAGNAANGDESAFEDWILLKEFHVSVGD